LRPGLVLCGAFFLSMAVVEGLARTPSFLFTHFNHGWREKEGRVY